MIILNEVQWAKEIIDKKEIGKKPSETLYRVAGYYLYLDDTLSKRKLELALERYILSCDPRIFIPKWQKIITYSVNKAFKRPITQIKGIAITKPELDNINQLGGKQLKRLAFTLLCLSKYYDIVNNSSEHWINASDKEIASMANINTAVKRQSYLYHVLMERGYIQFSRKIDNTNVRLCFMQDGETELFITDFRCLGNQYSKYVGEPFFECANCGIVSKINCDSVGRKQKYCKECAFRVKAKQDADAAIKRRRISYDSLEVCDKHSVL